jgi:hypothetical protein
MPLEDSGARSEPSWTDVMTRYSVALLPMITACLLMGASRDEVARASSSAGDLDAVLVETNGGATTSFGYFVYVVPHDGKPSEGTEVATLGGKAPSSPSSTEAHGKRSCESQQ